MRKLQEEVKEETKEEKFIRRLRSCNLGMAQKGWEEIHMEVKEMVKMSEREEGLTDKEEESKRSKGKDKNKSKEDEESRPRRHDIIVQQGLLYILGRLQGLAASRRTRAKQIARDMLEEDGMPKKACRISSSMSTEERSCECRRVTRTSLASKEQA